MRVQRLAVTLLLAVACTLLSLLASRVTYAQAEPCSAGATCAATVREAGWPLAFFIQEVNGQQVNETGINPAQLGWQMAPCAADVVFYSLLLMVARRILPWFKRTRVQPPRRS